MKMMISTPRPQGPGASARTPSSSRTLSTGLAALGLVAMLWQPLSAREPFTKSELAAQEALLLAQVDKGRDLWHGSKADMTTNGLACGNCHPDTSAANPQTFPKFLPAFNRVVAFREMVNWCIENPQAGKALGNEDMVAMEAYAMYLHRGVPIEPGLATRQTASVVVKSGVGYAKKPSGIGVDK